MPRAAGQRAEIPPVEARVEDDRDQSGQATQGAPTGEQPAQADAGRRDAQPKTLYIEAGCPWQNGYIESFNARLSEDCLNREELWTLTVARVLIEDWR
jgi:hypothetical protein